MLSTLVQTLSEIAQECEAEYDEGVDEELPTAEQLAIVLAAIRDARAGLAVLYGRVEKALMSMAGEKRFVVPELGEVTVQKRTKRTQWRHDEMVPAVIARIVDEHETLFDQETGELLPYAQIGLNVARRLHDCVGFGAGKVTGLRAIGMQPDEWCAETPDGWGVTLPPRSS